MRAHAWARDKESKATIINALRKVSSCYNRRLQKLQSRQKRREEGEAHCGQSIRQRNVFQAQLAQSESLRPEGREKAATIELLMNVAYGGAFSIGLVTSQYGIDAVAGAGAVWQQEQQSEKLAHAMHGPKSALGSPPAWRKSPKKNSPPSPPPVRPKKIYPSKKRASFAAQRLAAVQIQKVERGRQLRYQEARRADDYDADVQDDDDKRRVRVELARLRARLRCELETLSVDDEALEERAGMVIKTWLLENQDAAVEDVVDRVVLTFDLTVARLREIGQREGIAGLEYHARAEQSQITEEQLQAAERLGCAEAYILLLVEDASGGVFQVADETVAERERKLLQLKAIARLRNYGPKLRAELDGLEDELLEERAGLLIAKWLKKNPCADIDDVIDRLMQKFEDVVAYLKKSGREHGIDALEMHCRKAGVAEGDIDVAWSDGCTEGYILLHLKTMSSGVFAVRDVNVEEQQEERQRQVELAWYLQQQLAQKPSPQRYASTTGADPRLQQPVAEFQLAPVSHVDVAALPVASVAVSSPVTADSSHSNSQDKPANDDMKQLRAMKRKMDMLRNSPITSPSSAAQVTTAGSSPGDSNGHAMRASPEEVERELRRLKELQERSAMEARRVERLEVLADELEFVFKPHLVSKMLRACERDSKERFEERIQSLAKARPRFRSYLGANLNARISEKIEKMVKEYMLFAKTLQPIVYPSLLIKARELGELSATRRMFHSVGSAHGNWGKKGFQNRLRDVNALPDKQRKPALVRLMLETQYEGAFRPEPEEAEVEPKPKPRRKKPRSQKEISEPASWNGSPRVGGATGSPPRGGSGGKPDSARTPKSARKQRVSRSDERPAIVPEPKLEEEQEKTVGKDLQSQLEVLDLEELREKAKSRWFGGLDRWLARDPAPDHAAIVAKLMATFAILERRLLQSSVGELREYVLTSRQRSPRASVTAGEVQAVLHAVSEVEEQKKALLRLNMIDTGVLLAEPELELEPEPEVFHGFVFTGPIPASVRPQVGPHEDGKLPKPFGSGEEVRPSSNRLALFDSV